jgi:hypothetical protein
MERTLPSEVLIAAHMRGNEHGWKLASFLPALSNAEMQGYLRRDRVEFRLRFVEQFRRLKDVGQHRGQVDSSCFDAMYRGRFARRQTNVFKPDIFSALIRRSFELVAQSSTVLVQMPVERGGADDRDTTDQGQLGRVGYLVCDCLTVGLERLIFRLDVREINRQGRPADPAYRKPLQARDLVVLHLNKHCSLTDLYDLEYNEPETLWLLILEIHHRDQSQAIKQVLSAGPIEDLLAKHGETFINRVEAETRKDPLFAKVLGGVWQNSMGDAVWKRVQAVWTGGAGMESRSELPAKSGVRQLHCRSFSKPGWSQWVDATLSSDPHSLKTKAKCAG